MSNQADPSSVRSDQEKSCVETNISPPMLLTVGGYFGTLAAARCLGRKGVSIELADFEAKTPTARSKYIRRVMQSPNLDNLQCFGDWLVEFGRQNPGMVLYPTSDDLAWIMAKEQESLRKYYLLYQPPTEAVFKILNKQKLYQTAVGLGLEIPVTYFLATMKELDELKNRIQYPVIVKPKTQVGMFVNVKGLVCRNKDELVTNVRQFLERFSYKAELLSYDADLRWPLIQQFHQEASSHTYCLSGFIVREDSVMVVRAAQKVLQQPFQVGVGLAFESRPINQAIKEKVQKLCKTIGYFGVFEAEFIYEPKTGRFLLMDFNPRFYGQMGFDIKRSLPLPYLVYLAAMGQKAKLQEALTHADQWDHSVIHKYCFGWMMRVLLHTQWLGGRLGNGKRQEWLKWAMGDQLYDGITDAEDRGPEKAYVKQQLVHMLRHPRSNFRYYFR
jgi:predicted ATP-grasp superfamily ATP-dependent carboligase